MRPYFLLSNDDGVDAPGLQFLIEALRPHADLLVMAPDGPRSGFSCSITSSRPLTYRTLREEEGLTVCACSGTPVDCVKMAINLFGKPNAAQSLLGDAKAGKGRTDNLFGKPGAAGAQPANLFNQGGVRRFDLIIGGINHGDNSSVNAHYSGTMGVAIEGALQGYPSIAFSLCDERRDADFEPLKPYLVDFSLKAVMAGMPAFTCLNVNFPKAEKFQGVKVCRMARTRWVNEVKEQQHPRGGNYYWLVGENEELEPEDKAADTDRWALHHDYVAITPTQLDVTATELLEVYRQMFV